MTEFRGPLLAGVRVELYADDQADQPYATGVITRVETTLEGIQVSVERDPPEAEVDELTVTSGGTARPSGWAT